MTPQSDTSNAAAALLAEFTPRLYRYALVRLGRVDLAEDAVSETLCRLIEKGPGVDGPRSHVHGWCVRCVVNVCREISRRPRTQALNTGDDACGTQQASYRMEAYRIERWQMAATEHGQQRAELVHAMLRLSERQREAVTLRVLMGLSVAEASQAMQCAQGTVKALTHQGLHALRQQLPEEVAG
ncbi:MAG: RNA polymerase sigma factor [Phycisphaerales bacterium]